MDDIIKKAHDRFSKEFEEMFNTAPAKWTPECVETMKNLLKSIYYTEVLAAMHDSQQENQNGSSYGGRNVFYDNNHSGYYRPMNSYNRNGGMSGRRYFDGEKERAMAEIRERHDMEQNPEIKAAYRRALEELEMR